VVLAGDGLRWIRPTRIRWVPSPTPAGWAVDSGLRRN